MTNDPEPPCKETPKSGWYARLDADEVDLEHWRHSLKEPFDPIANELPDGQTVLRSVDFDNLSDASEVRERALTLISRLNGSLNLSTAARSVRFGGIIKIDESGKQHTTVFVEAFGNVNIFGRATATLLGPDGKPLPPPRPVPSKAQIWNRLAQENKLISDLLDHFGRADHWYEIYKTIEIARLLVGGEATLKSLLGEAVNLNNLKQNANFHRHAREEAPKRRLSLEEARQMLAVVVSMALEAIEAEFEQSD